MVADVDIVVMRRAGPQNPMNFHAKKNCATVYPFCNFDDNFFGAGEGWLFLGFAVLKLFCAAPLPVPEAAVPVTASQAPLCESYRNVDQKGHSINDAFIARSGENNSGLTDQDVFLLTNPNFPCDLKATVDKKVPRLQALSKLKGLASALLGQSVGGGSSVRVDYVHPDELDLFRPGADQHHNRKWDISKQGGELVEGTADGERTVWLPKITLNGEDINVGDWIYFLRATSKAATAAEMLKDAETTVSLARLLKIVMKIPRTSPDKQRRYIHFIFAYKNKSGVVRVLRSTSDWIHAPVPRTFQDMLNLDQKALVPFTVKCPDLQGQLVKSLAKLMQNSDQHTGSRAESDATESDEHASTEVFVNKEPTQEVVELKAQLVSVKGKLSKRKAKLKAQAELLELRKTSAKDRASLKNLQNVSTEKADLVNKYSTVVRNYDNLSSANGRNKTTNKELRKEVTDLKKQVAALEQEESEALQHAGEEKASLLSQLGNLKNKITELEGLLKEANAQVDESQAEIAALKDKYKAVKEDLNTAKAEARAANVKSKRDRSVSPSSDACRHSHHYRGRHYKPLSKRAKCDRSSDSESDCTKKTSPNKRYDSGCQSSQSAGSRSFQRQGGHSRKRIDERTVSEQHAKRLKKSREYQACKRSAAVVEAAFPSDEELQAMLLSAQGRQRFPKTDADRISGATADLTREQKISYFKRLASQRSANKKAKKSFNVGQLRKPRLAELCQQLGLSSVGTVPELKERLQAHMAQQPNSVSPEGAAADSEVPVSRLQNKSFNVGKLRKPRLVELCQQLGLSSVGTVPELKERLKAHMAQQPNSVSPEGAAADSEVPVSSGKKGVEKRTSKQAATIKPTASNSSGAAAAASTRQPRSKAAKVDSYAESDAEDDEGSEYEEPATRWMCAYCNYPNPLDPGDQEFAGCINCGGLASSDDESDLEEDE
eukprot:g36237.t1